MTPEEFADKEQRVREFMRVLEEETGQVIAYGEAEILLRRLVYLYQELRKPLPCEAKDNRILG